MPAPNQTHTTTLGAAREYTSRGWRVVPVPHTKKEPVTPGWPDLRLEESELSRHFPDPSNVGLLLGEPSGGLVDVDVDSPEAVAVAPAFLPHTRLIHGRQGKPHSHYWYLADPIPDTKRFRAPDGTCLVELRSTGAQTIVPPSIHPSGEVITWSAEGSPAEIHGSDLRAAVARLASCALLVRYWPALGARHDAALAAAGFLLRGGLDEVLVARLIETAARAAGDEEWYGRGRAARDTVRHLAAGQAATGGPTLADILLNGEKVVFKLQDWLGLHGTAEVSTAWEPPLPFVDRQGPSFPQGVFPEPVQAFVQAQAHALQVPSDLVGSLVLGVAAAAAAGRCIVRLNQEWVEPLNLFVVAALLSGERKSPAFRAVTAPIEERERELVQLARPEVEMQKAERDVLERRHQNAKTQAAKEKGEDRREDAMREVASLARALADFVVPTMPRLLADDATSEAVASLLANHGGRIAVMSTEGGLFETLAGRYAEGALNIDVYLKGYSGDPLRVDRKTRPPEYVAKPALTLCLTVQPEVIRDLAGKPGFRGRGLLARFLYSIPRSMVGYRSSTAPPVPNELRQHWHQTIMGILRLPDPPEGQEQAIRLSPEAQGFFQGFRDQVERQLRPGAELSDIADWGNKLAGAVARLAGILHLFEHAGEARPWENPVSGATVEAAIRLGRYYAQHAAVAFALMGADPRVEKARLLWAVIEHHGFDRFSQRDLHLNVRRRFTVAELADGLKMLEEMGYVRRLPQPSPGPGRPQSPTFDVNPLARTQNTQNPQNPVGGAISEDSEDSVYAPSSHNDDVAGDVGEV